MTPYPERIQETDQLIRKTWESLEQNNEGQAGSDPGGVGRIGRGRGRGGKKGRKLNELRI